MANCKYPGCPENVFPPDRFCGRHKPDDPVVVKWTDYGGAFKPDLSGLDIFEDK